MGHVEQRGRVGFGEVDGDYEGVAKQLIVNKLLQTKRASGTEAIEEF